MSREPDPAATSQGRKSGAGSRAGIVLVGLAVMTMGGSFCWLLWRGYERALVTHRWVETPCTIVSSGFDGGRPTPNSPEAYTFEVEYAYVVDGVTHTADQYRRVTGPTKHKKHVEAFVERFPAGRETVCYVNPDAPGEAVLKRDTKAPLYTIWFPGLFVVGGAGIAFSGIVGRRRGSG